MPLFWIESKIRVVVGIRRYFHSVILHSDWRAGRSDSLTYSLVPPSRGQHIHSDFPNKNACQNHAYRSQLSRPVFLIQICTRPTGSHPDHPPAPRPLQILSPPPTFSSLLQLSPSSIHPVITIHHHHHFSSSTLTHSSNKSHTQWLVPSRQPVNPLVARPLVSSLLPRPPVRLPPPPEVSRSLTVTSLVPSLSVRSVATRSPLSS